MAQKSKKSRKEFQNKVVKEDGEWFVHIYQAWWVIEDQPLCLVCGPFSSRNAARQVKTSLDVTFALMCELVQLEITLAEEN